MSNARHNRRAVKSTIAISEIEQSYALLYRLETCGNRRNLFARLETSPECPILSLLGRNKPIVGAKIGYVDHIWGDAGHAGGAARDRFLDFPAILSADGLQLGGAKVF
jgi:hypothetical protein